MMIISEKLRDILEVFLKMLPWPKDIDVMALFVDVISYCSVTFKSRFEKLMKDITHNQDEQYIKSFRSFLSNDSIDVDNIDDIHMSRTYCEYYKKVKKSSSIS